MLASKTPFCKVSTGNETTIKPRQPYQFSVPHRFQNATHVHTDGMTLRMQPWQHNSFRNMLSSISMDVIYIFFSKTLKALFVSKKNGEIMEFKDEPELYIYIYMRAINQQKQAKCLKLIQRFQRPCVGTERVCGRTPGIAF